MPLFSTIFKTNGSLLLSAALAIVLGLSACKKEETDTSPEKRFGYLMIDSVRYVFTTSYTSTQSGGFQFTGRQLEVDTVREELTVFLPAGAGTGTYPVVKQTTVLPPTGRASMSLTRQFAHQSGVIYNSLDAGSITLTNVNGKLRGSFAAITFEKRSPGSPQQPNRLTQVAGEISEP